MLPDLFYGKRITLATDPLQRISPARLFEGIRSSKATFRDQIAQLRTLNAVDPKEYRSQKKFLPYFVCGVFHPQVRRLENFARTHYCLLDIDHLAEVGVDRVQLATQLQQSEKVLLLFASPSNNGLKVLFRLKEACSDSALFSAFYKLFALDIAEEYQLTSCLDLRTSDATRACFISYDPYAYFNPEARPIDLTHYLAELNHSEVEKKIKQADQKLLTKSPKPKFTPDDQILQKIKDKLNPRPRKIANKQHFVPEQINQLMPKLEASLVNWELQIEDHQPISYGRQLRITCGALWAEVNLFYGKRGYTVVSTTKTGSNQELATLAQEAILQTIEGIQNP